jgi:hypothetical protein
MCDGVVATPRMFRLARSVNVQSEQQAKKITVWK